MAKNSDYKTIRSGYYSTDDLNQNFEKIEQDLQNTVSRDGSTPNAMESQLDMNGQRIINVGDAVDDNDVLTRKVGADLVADAEQAVVDAEAAQTAAETAETNASASATAAASSASSAASSATDAQTAQTAAETAQTGAEAARDEAQVILNSLDFETIDVSASRSITDSDHLKTISVDATSAVTLTLPLATSLTEDIQFMVVKRTGGNGVTIDTSGSETVGGESSIVMDLSGVTRLYKSDKDNGVWYVSKAGESLSGSGTNSILIGDGAAATGIDDISIGTGAGVGSSRDGTISIGKNALGNWTRAIAIGEDSASNAQDSVAIGKDTTSSGVSIGVRANAGSSSISIGADADGSGANAVALGRLAEADGTQAVAIGVSSRAFGTRSGAFGYGANCIHNNSTCIGDSSESTATDQIRLGTATHDVSIPGTLNGRDLTADGTKLDGIEAGADVTDETNVTSALDGATLTTATVAGTDKVLIQDTDDSDNLKTVTAQSIADLAGGGGGVILRTSVMDGSTQCSTTTSFADITDGSITLTPASSSSTFQIIAIPNCRTEDTTVLGLRILRDATVLESTYKPVTYNSNASQIGVQTPVMVLDAPATASSITYKVQFNRTSGTSNACINNGTAQNGIFHVIEYL